MSRLGDFVENLNNEELLQFFEKSGYPECYLILKDKNINGNEFMNLTFLDLKKWDIPRYNMTCLQSCIDHIKEKSCSPIQGENQYLDMTLKIYDEDGYLNPKHDKLSTPGKSKIPENSQFEDGYMDMRKNRIYDELPSRSPRPYKNLFEEENKPFLRSAKSMDNVNLSQKAKSYRRETMVLNHSLNTSNKNDEYIYNDADEDSGEEVNVRQSLLSTKGNPYVTSPCLRRRTRTKTFIINKINSESNENQNRSLTCYKNNPSDSESTIDHMRKLSLDSNRRESILVPKSVEFSKFLTLKHRPLPDPPGAKSKSSSCEVQEPEEYLDMHKKEFLDVKTPFREKSPIFKGRKISEVKNKKQFEYEQKPLLEKTSEDEYCPFVDQKQIKTTAHCVKSAPTDDIIFEDEDEYATFVFDLNNEKYYRNLDRNGANLLLSTFEEGAFVFRPSKKYFLAMTVKYGNNYYHLGIERSSSNKFYGVTENFISPEFSTLNEIVDYYHKEPLFLRKGADIYKCFLNPQI